MLITVSVEVIDAIGLQEIKRDPEISAGGYHVHFSDVRSSQ